MKTSNEICARYGEDDYECDDCGDYTKWQPCNERVPNYIPNIQIKRFISGRLKNV
jgi:hypothetical protein